MTKEIRKARRSWARKASKAERLDAMRLHERLAMAPSRVPLWLRFLLARLGCSGAWFASSIFALIGLWLSRPGRDCWAWRWSDWLSSKGLGFFQWATGHRSV